MIERGRRVCVRIRKNIKKIGKNNAKIYVKIISDLETIKQGRRIYRPKH